jgi:hypothetical protein
MKKASMIYAQHALQINLALALLVAGIALIVYGFGASDAVCSDVPFAFSGAPALKTIWLLLGGSASMVAGAALLGVWPFNQGLVKSGIINAKCKIQRQQPCRKQVVLRGLPLKNTSPIKLIAKSFNWHAFS